MSVSVHWSISHQTSVCCHPSFLKVTEIRDASLEISSTSCHPLHELFLLFQSLTNVDFRGRVDIHTFGMKPGVAGLTQV